MISPNKFRRLKTLPSANLDRINHPNTPNTHLLFLNSPLTSPTIPPDIPNTPAARIMIMSVLPALACVPAMSSGHAVNAVIPKKKSTKSTHETIRYNSNYTEFVSKADGPHLRNIVATKEGGKRPARVVSDAISHRAIKDPIKMTRGKIRKKLRLVYGESGKSPYLVSQNRGLRVFGGPEEVLMKWRVYGCH